MNKLLRVLLGLAFAFTTMFAQLENEENETPVMTSTKVAGMNLLGPFLGLYSGSLGIFQKNGKVEIKVSPYYWDVLNVGEIIIMGGGVNYRMYKNEGGKGVFYGPFAKINMVSWDYEYYDFYYSDYPITEEISGQTFAVGAELGRRWYWKSGFTIAPTMSYSFGVGEIKAESTGETADFDAGGFGLGLGLGWMF